MIDYQTRMKLITSSLNEFLKTHFQPPEGTSEEARLGRLREMAEAVNSRISTSCDRDVLGSRLDEVKRRILATYKGRDWPKVAHFVDAMGETMTAGKAATATELTAWARQLWFDGNPDTKTPPKTCIPPANTWEIAKALIGEGADPWELRYAGFETDSDHFRDLEAQGRPWRGHAARISEIRATVESLEAAE